MKSAQIHHKKYIPYENHMPQCISVSKFSPKIYQNIEKNEVYIRMKNGTVQT